MTAEPVSAGLARAARAAGRPWPPPYPEARPDPLAPPEGYGQPPPDPAAQVGRAGPGDGRCRCTATMCRCEPCPGRADGEDLLCGTCRDWAAHPVPGQPPRSCCHRPQVVAGILARLAGRPASS
jgi:hypothetical protein